MARDKTKGRAGEAAAKQAAGAGREGAEEMATAARNAAQQAAGSAGRMLETSSEQLRRGSEQAANQAAQNLDVMMGAGSALAEGMQSVWQECVSYTQSAMETNVRGCNKLLRSTTLTDFIAAQNELMHQEMELLLNSTGRISELSSQAVNNAAERIGTAGR